MKENKKHIDQWLKDSISSAEYQPKMEDWQAFEALYFKEKKKKGVLWIYPLIIIIGSLIYISQLDKNENKKTVYQKNSEVKKLSKNKPSLTSDHLKENSNFNDQKNYISYDNSIKHINILNDNQSNKLYNSIIENNNEAGLTKSTSNNISNEAITDSNNNISDVSDSVISIYNKNIDSIPKVLDNIYNKPTDKNKYPKQLWCMGIDTYCLLAGKQTSTNNNIDVELSKKINYMVEGFIGLNIKKNINIQTGLGFYQTHFNTISNENSLNVNTSFSQVTNINIDTASKRLVKVTHQIAQYDTVYSQSKKQASVSINYIYLPVNIKYQLPISKKLNLTTTIGFNYYIQTSTKITGEGLTQISLLPKTNKSINLGLDMGYKIANKLQLSAGIYLYTFTKNTNIYLITHQQNLNAHLGVIYSF